jgi:FkbM family methyltransferase
MNDLVQDVEGSIDSVFGNFGRYALRRIRPISLRERLFYRLALRIDAFNPREFNDATLHFAPSVKMRLSPTDVAHRMIASSGFYELPLSRRLASLAKEGGLLVDAGANYGYYTCIWAAARTDNRVVAFEVAPANVTAIADNVSRNGFGDRVVVNGQALGNRKGEAFFSLGPEDQTGQGGLVPVSNANVLAVDMTTLDDVFADSVKTVDVLKIDVEGADTWVLEGASRLLAEQRISHIFFEQFPARMKMLGIAEDAAHRLLAKFGYQVTEVAESEYYASVS